MLLSSAEFSQEKEKDLGDLGDSRAASVSQVLAPKHEDPSLYPQCQCKSWGSNFCLSRNNSKKRKPSKTWWRLSSQHSGDRGKVTSEFEVSLVYSEFQATLRNPESNSTPIQKLKVLA